MKAWKAGAVVLLGLVLAAPAWGHSVSGTVVRFINVPDQPRKCLARVDVPDTTLSTVRYIVMSFGYYTGVQWIDNQHSRLYAIQDFPVNNLGKIVRCGGSFKEWDTLYRIVVRVTFNRFLGTSGHTHTHTVTYRTPEEPGTEPEPETPTPPEPPSPPPEPEPPEPEPPTPPEPPSPPPEPEPPEPEPPTPPEPEPEVPDPEEPDHTHPVERCDHIAIVPAMPRALSGDEGSPDHWLRISNLGAASITFAITGLDEGGTKAGTYRRELPASRIVRVKMRDVEAAFDVEPEGWWRLVVTGSGPVEVVATMRQGAERRFVPVRTPATCTSGPVTRAGG